MQQVMMVSARDSFDETDLRSTLISVSTYKLHSYTFKVHQPLHHLRRRRQNIHWEFFTPNWKEQRKSRFGNKMDSFPKTAVSWPFSPAFQLLFFHFLLLLLL